MKNAKVKTMSEQQFTSENLEQLQQQTRQNIKKDAKTIKQLACKTGKPEKQGKLNIRFGDYDYWMKWEEGEIQYLSRQHKIRGGDDDIYLISQYDPATINELTKSSTDYMQFVIQFLKWYKKRNNEEPEKLPPTFKKENETKDTVTLTERIEDELELQRSNAKLSDIKELIKQRKQSIVEAILSSDEEDAEAVDKWWKHYDSEEETYVQSEIEILHHSMDYLLIKSEQTSRRVDGTYSAAWVVGVDREQPSGFFVHRLEYTKELDDEEYNWTKKDIRQEMGYDKEYQGGDIKQGEKVRIQGDIYIERSNTKIENIKEKLVKQRTKEELKGKEVKKEARYIQQNTKTIPEHGEITIRYSKNAPYGFRLRIKVKRDTSLLKEFQEEVNIKEEDVRQYQEKQEDWKKLTAKRRKNAINSLLRKRLEKKVGKVCEEEKIKSQKEKELMKEWKENERQLNSRIGNHLIMASDAIRQGREIRRIRNISRSEAGAVTVLIREKTKFYIIHDEHQSQEMMLHPGIYKIDALERHQQN